MKKFCLMLLCLCLIFTLVACGEAVTLQSATVNENGDLILTMSDGTTHNAGKVKGEQGEKGEKGEKGDPGAGSDYTDAENSNGLNFYLLPDGTYGVYPQYAFYSENIVIPAVYNEKPVTYIGMPTATTLNDLGILYGFGTTGVKTIVLPDTITHIGVDAFYNCSELTSITIPASVTSIAKEAFYDCDKLESITFANKVGWGVDGTPVTVTDDVAANAVLLTQTHTFKTWTRTETP